LIFNVECQVFIVMDLHIQHRRTTRVTVAGEEYHSYRSKHLDLLSRSYMKNASGDHPAV
jgi:hypothetical protein